MTSAASSGAISGAAQGVATGAMFGVPGMIVGGGLGFLGGLISGSSADSQFNNQMAWANYNRQSQYNTDIFNIQTGLAVAGLNAMLARQAAKQNAENIMAAAVYNSSIIEMTLEYNNELLENELTQTWNNLGLDVSQIEATRSRERGMIVAEQGASGTVIGSGSNAAVVQDQMTQEAMDINVVTFGAERQAAGIANEMAQGTWQGRVAIQQTMWEGEMAAFTTQYNAAIQSAGQMGSAILNATAGLYNAKQAYTTAGYNITQAGSQFNAQNKQDMISGLFSAAASYGAGAYARKVPGPKTTTGSGFSKPYSGPLSPTYTSYGNAAPGSSLAVGP